MTRVLDLANAPDLGQLAAEVNASGEAASLCRDGEEVARLVPPRRRPTQRRKPPTQADIDAFLSSAGGWASVDTEAFLKANRESPDLPGRPLVEF